MTSTGDYMSISSITALVIDDNANTRTLISEVLRSLGVRKIHQADSASAGWAILEGGDVELVLADIEMPGESGLDLVRRIRAWPDSQIAEAVVVMISAQATEGRVIAAGAVGANGFLSKPFSVASFVRCLVEGFEHRRKTLEALARLPIPLAAADPRLDPPDAPVAED